MRWIAALFSISVAMAQAQLPEALDPATAPKTWQEDLRLMMRHGHLEPSRRDTFTRFARATRHAQKRRVTKNHRYAICSTAWGIIGFRENNPMKPDEVGSILLIGIHASAMEPPPFPIAVENQIGGIALGAKASVVLPADEPLHIEEETYFGEKCRAYVYGAGHWIRRIYVRGDRVIALSFGLEP